MSYKNFLRGDNAPEVFAGEFDALGLAADDVVEFDPFRVGFVALHAEARAGVVFERGGAIGHELAFAQSDAHAADPIVFVAVVANVGRPYFRRVERLRTLVFRFGEPIVAPAEFDDGGFGVFRISTAEQQSKSGKIRMRGDEKAVALQFECDGLALVLDREAVLPSYEFKRAAIGGLIDAGEISGVFNECCRSDFWSGREGLLFALGAHELNGELRDGIGAIALHGVDGGEGADTFVDVDL